MGNKLTEADKLLHFLRIEYDALIATYPNVRSLKIAFEERYWSVLQRKDDLLLFLREEVEFFTLYVKTSIAQKQSDALASTPLELQDSYRRIHTYPSLIGLHSHCTLEVVKLYGAVNELVERYWRTLSICFEQNGPEYNIYIERIEMGLPEVYSPDGKLPRGLALYHSMIEGMIGSQTERIRAGQNAMQCAGIWLSKLKNDIHTCYRSASGDNSSIQEALSYISKVIRDFHLGPF